MKDRNTVEDRESENIEYLTLFLMLHRTFYFKTIGMSFIKLEEKLLTMLDAD